MIRYTHPNYGITVVGKTRVNGFELITCWQKRRGILNVGNNFFSLFSIEF